MGPSAAAFIAAWIASFVIGFSVSNVRSTMLTSTVGTRIDWPSNLPLSAGMTSERALAAPVVDGIMFTAAARARRRSPLRCGMSRTAWSLVYEWMVVIRPALDAEGVEQHLGHRGEAVGRARAARDDGVLGRVVDLGVHAEDDGRVLALGGRADDDLLGAGREVRGRLVLVGEEARALEDDVGAELLPRQLGGVLLGDDLRVHVAEVDGALERLRGMGRAAVDAVVVVEVRERLRVGQVVDGDELEVLDVALGEGADDAASDAAEAVDGDLRGHGGGCSGKPAMSGRGGT